MAEQRWQRITPKKLVGAIRRIRQAFLANSAKCSRVTATLGYVDLHALSVEHTLAESQWALLKLLTHLGPEKKHRFDQLIHSGTSPAVFKAYRDVFRGGLEKAITIAFGEMLLVGKQNAILLDQHPIDWAKGHCSMLIQGEVDGVRDWVQLLCDGEGTTNTVDNRNGTQATKPTSNSNKWRAPKLIEMQPAGLLPYSSETEWMREDEASTKAVLQSISREFTDQLKNELEAIAGNAHVRLAITDPTVKTKKTSQPRPVHSRQYRPDPRKVLIAELKARNRNASALKICELIDRNISSTPGRQFSLAPLESWQKRAPGKRSWVQFFNDSKTYNRVRTYVNKVPRLKTSTKSST